MDTIKLTVGSKLEPELFDRHDKRIGPVMVSQFEAFLPDGSMEILTPIYEGRIYTVHTGAQMNVIYHREECMFKFLAEVLDRRRSGNIHILKIQPRSGEEPYQRRNFFRMNCLLDIQYRLFAQNPGKKAVKEEFQKGVTRNLSGGGLCLLLNEKPAVGWILEGVMNVGQEVRFKGRVIRVSNMTDKTKYHYEVGAEFTEITSKDRERIIGFIFDSQRKLLNKGWHIK